MTLQVHLIENHDKAYYLWRDAGIKNRILVHIDAHHDMKWIDDEELITIANFICPALKEKIVREVYWVVPDRTWETAPGRNALRRHLKEIIKKYPGEQAVTRWEDRHIRTAVLECPFIVCTLSSLPSFSEDVLLDIDTDYLTIPSVSFYGWDRHDPLPWRWPTELVSSLHAAHVSSDFVTIAYSVEGGYTPLKWKYLGDEVAARLKLPQQMDAPEPYDKMREALIAQNQGDLATAQKNFRSVGDKLGSPPHFALAHLLANAGRTEEARRFYERALALNPSYRNAWANAGLVFYGNGRYEAAEDACRRTLLLDPTDPYSHLGLGWIAARRKRWEQAVSEFSASLALQPDLIDAQRGIAHALEKGGQLENAIRAYEKSIKLALEGRKPLGSEILTNPALNRFLDRHFGRIQARLARLYERKGDFEQAIACYRMGIRSGYDRPSIRFRLASLYAKKRRWDDAYLQAFEGLRETPETARALVLRLKSRFHVFFGDKI